MSKEWTEHSSSSTFCSVLLDNFLGWFCGGGISREEEDAKTIPLCQSTGIKHGQKRPWQVTFNFYRLQCFNKCTQTSRFAVGVRYGMQSIGSAYGLFPPVHPSTNNLSFLSLQAHFYLFISIQDGNKNNSNKTKCSLLATPALSLFTLPNTDTHTCIQTGKCPKYVFWNPLKKSHNKNKGTTEILHTKLPTWCTEYYLFVKYYYSPNKSNNIWRINNIQCIALVVLYGQFMMHGQRNIKRFYSLYLLKNV